MAVSANFVPGTGVLTTTGDDLDNTMTTSRNAAGSILVNGGAVAIVGGTPTVRQYHPDQHVGPRRQRHDLVRRGDRRAACGFDVRRQR
jgi:hypothetical protein